MAQSEFELIGKYFARLGAERSDVRIGVGDDGAVLMPPASRELVAVTDTLVEAVHFPVGSPAASIGHRAFAVNLSDIAAMGAVPTALVVAIAAPSNTPVALLEGIADGLRDACEALALGCGVVGGDLSVSSVLTIAVTAFGDLQGRAPVLRSGARVGDVVAVSGGLGQAALGLHLLFARAVDEAGEPDAALAAALRQEHPAPIAAQLAPRPPIADGVAAALGGATAMIDLSDGLVLDARRIALASGVAIDLDSEAVGERAALDGGEDHSLFATFPSGVPLPGGFRRIGTVVTGEGVLVDGDPYELRGGWDPYREWDGGVG